MCKLGDTGGGIDSIIASGGAAKTDHCHTKGYVGSLGGRRPTVVGWQPKGGYVVEVGLDLYGGFQNRGTPKWMVYNEKPYKNG